MHRWIFALCAASFAGVAAGAAAPQTTIDDELRRCARLPTAEERLHCFEALAAAAEARESDSGAAPAATAERSPSTPAPVSGAEPSALARHWDLDGTTRQGTFALTGDRANYVLPVTYNFRPNQEPFDPVQLEVEKPEAMFQLSVMLKLAEGVGGSRGDLWFGYTQRSWWQVYNAAQSRPFRETNYEPSLAWVQPTHVQVLGVNASAVSLALDHQSNGRGPELSRSWNRIIGTLMLERGNFVGLVSAWIPFAYRDDNPDITDYLGYGQLQLGWRFGGHTLSVLVRNPLDWNAGRLGYELDWAFPLPFTHRIRGYAQYYYGYGESLLDYNAITHRVGIGVAISDWF